MELLLRAEGEATGAMRVSALRPWSLHEGEAEQGNCIVCVPE